MNDLVSVGGICFVAVSSAANLSDQSDRSDKSDIAESPVSGEAAGGKRKYRPRGERSRKEQQRAASRHYYREHRAEISEKQKSYRQKHREYFREYLKQYHLLHREQSREYQRQYRLKHQKGKGERGKAPPDGGKGKR